MKISLLVTFDVGAGYQTHTYEQLAEGAKELVDEALDKHGLMTPDSRKRVTTELLPRPFAEWLAEELLTLENSDAEDV